MKDNPPKREAGYYWAKWKGYEDIPPFIIELQEDGRVLRIDGYIHGTIDEAIILSKRLTYLLTAFI